MKQSQRIVKNAVVGIVAGLIGGLVYLFTLVAIARNPHVTLPEFGEYQWVLTFAMIAQLVADSGLGQRQPLARLAPGVGPPTSRPMSRQTARSRKPPAITLTVCIRPRLRPCDQTATHPRQTRSARRGDRTHR